MLPASMFMDVGLMFFRYAIYEFFFYMFLLQYIGTKETDQKSEVVPRLGIMDLWTPENHYRWSGSRYGNHVSASVEQVNPPDLLSNSMKFY